MFVVVIVVILCTMERLNNFLLVILLECGYLFESFFLNILLFNYYAAGLLMKSLTLN